ncbi:MAG: 3-deoxy-D-manno-octulosonic-acid transferase [Chthoniobacter sp.]|nr:3-deoxy-D-manno-octulosonic-acid transferase [Chthoniobacter sp.]
MTCKMPTELTAAARRSLFVYNLLFPLVFLALVPGYLSRMFRRGGFRENFSQRLGRYSEADRSRFASGRWFWIHSISVGETLIALKLAHELHQRDPALRLVISVTTSTGFALARQSCSEWLTVLYNPIDAPSIVCAALDLIRPAHLILIEGEAWPNLLAECHRRGIPVALVNARLSPRSERRFLRARFWVSPVFRLIDLLCVCDPADVARWRALGLREDTLRVTGSIKYDSAADAPPAREDEFRALLAPLGVGPATPILVAGSTWAPEEKILAQTFLELRRTFPQLFLIIVPRHVERSAEILRELSSLHLRILRRSSLPLPSPGPCDAVLVDTTGELRDWYALATVVFVGKSLPGVAEIGGQNPAEPALLGKPTVFGPHMENFAALVGLLLSQDAAVRADEPASLTQALATLLHDPALRLSLGNSARRALLEHRGATTRTAAALLRASPA